MKNDDLPLKYRPQDLDEVLGQGHIVKSLQSFLDKDNVPHAFLFSGPSGVGKTTVARILADDIGCVNKNNIIEFDAASYSGVDSLRKLISGSMYKGMGGSDIKVYIIDECHALSKQAWQAMLKSLEEPLPHIYYILCTTELSKVPKTIQTRCTSYIFKEASTDDVLELLNDIADSENMRFKEDILSFIAKQSKGSFRQAVVNLSACQNVFTKKEAANILATVADEKEIIDLCRLLISGRGGLNDALGIIKSIDKAGAVQPESIRLMVLNYMAKVALNNPKNVESVLSIMDAFSTPCNPSEKMAPIIIALGIVYLS